MTRKRLNELFESNGKGLTVNEVHLIAEALDVHPFALLWPEELNGADLISADKFFKNLTIEKIRAEV